MQILLSPAKKMHSSVPTSSFAVSTPRFLSQALDIAAHMSRYDGEELATILGTTPRLGARAAMDFAALLAKPKTAPASLLYAGMAYQHLRAEEFSAEEMDYAQAHLWITSFLYGLNRPLDGIAPYRLEGPVPAPGAEERSLFDYWKPLLTDVLIDSVRTDDGVLLNLASGEMKRLFDWARVERTVQVISPEFRVMQGDKQKTIVVYAKMMRGALTRHVLTHRIVRPEDLRDFEYEVLRLGAKMKSRVCGCAAANSVEKGAQDVRTLELGHGGEVQSVVDDEDIENAVALCAREAEEMHGRKVHAQQIGKHFCLLAFQDVRVHGAHAGKSAAHQIEVGESGL